MTPLVLRQNNNNAEKAQALAATLCKLDLPAVTAHDVEWMYGYPEAVTLLDTIQRTFGSCADDCLISPLGIQSENILPAELSDPILLALSSDEIGDTSSSYPALQRANRSAHARVDALRNQVSILERLVAHEGLRHSDSKLAQSGSPEVSRSLENDPSRTTSSDPSKLSELRYAIMSFSRTSKYVYKCGLNDSNALVHNISNYQLAESRLWQLATVMAKAKGSCGNFSANRSVSETSNCGIDSLPECEAEPNMVSLLAHAVGASEEEFHFARARLARATSCYQALRQFRSHHVASQSETPVETLEEDVSTTRRAWQNMLASDVAPLVCRTGYHRLVTRARVYELRESLQRQQVQDTRCRHLVPLLLRQHARTVILHEIMRFRLQQIKESLLEVRCYIDESAKTCLASNGEDLLVNSPSSSVTAWTVGMDLENSESVDPSLGHNRTFYVSTGSEAIGGSLEWFSKFSSLLNDFRGQFGSSSSWLQIERSEGMTKALRALRDESDTAAHLLHLLLKGKAVKIENINSQSDHASHNSRFTWIDFYKNSPATHYEREL